MKSAQKLILVFVLNSLIWFGVTSNKMFAQEIDSDHKTTDTNKVETKDLNGKLLLNGKAVEFSTLDELQAITERLVKESNNGTAKTKKIIPNYLEMNSDDLAKTKTFYRKAFGFEFIDYGSQYAAISSGQSQLDLQFERSRQPLCPRSRHSKSNQHLSQSRLQMARSKNLFLNFQEVGVLNSQTYLAIGSPFFKTTDEHHRPWHFQRRQTHVVCKTARWGPSIIFLQ